MSRSPRRSATWPPSSSAPRPAPPRSRPRGTSSTTPFVFEDTNAAKQALLNGQVDAIIADLPTAVFISGFEIKNSVVIGQFVDPNIGPDQFGMLFGKGDPLVSCVNAALAALTADGTLDALQAQWLADYQAVPVLQ